MAFSIIILVSSRALPSHRLHLMNIQQSLLAVTYIVFPHMNLSNVTVSVYAKLIKSVDKIYFAYT